MAGAALAFRAAEHARWIGPATLIVALLVLALTAGPLALAAGIAMGWLGWIGRAEERRSRSLER